MSRHLKEGGDTSATPDSYRHRLEALKKRFHSKCLFNGAYPFESVSFGFTPGGRIEGTFSFLGCHEGYDGMVHGGIIAAVIDASMAQCLMGHGIVAYTADLNIKYRKPVRIKRAIYLRTAITSDALGKLYRLETHIMQSKKTCATAHARFFRI